MHEWYRFELVIKKNRLPGRAGVNSSPELEFIGNSRIELVWNCHHWNWIGIAIIGIELELPSLELHSTELYSELKSDMSMMSLV